MKKRIAIIVALAISMVSCSRQSSTPPIHFKTETFPPQTELLRQVREHDGPDSPYIFTFPYLLFNLSSGEEFGHNVEALCISFKGETNVTVLVCDSIPWTKPVEFALSSHGTVEFALADMQSDQFIGKYSFGLKSKLIRTRD